MADTTHRDVYDDGRGHLLPSREPQRQEMVKLVLKENWEEALSPGDYAFSGQIGSWGIEVLVMKCPFCGLEAPMPLLTKITEKEPLTIQEELSCGKCGIFFHVIRGEAIRSWFPGGIPCQK